MAKCKHFGPLLQAKKMQVLEKASVSSQFPQSREVDQDGAKVDRLLYAGNDLERARTFLRKP